MPRRLMCELFRTKVHGGFLGGMNLLVILSENRVHLLLKESNEAGLWPHAFAGVVRIPVGIYPHPS